MHAVVLMIFVYMPGIINTTRAPIIGTKTTFLLTFVPYNCTITDKFKIRIQMTAPQVKTTPSLRKMESDLEVNKTTLHNWKQNRPKLYEFIIESYQDRKALKENIMFLIDQKQKLEERLNLEQTRVS